ncbi:MAG TPA: dTMP kinase [Candidatus Methanoperedens sp.]|nr:dTMP kinase [Candidatus Methanoperedens sp.]
MKIPVIAMKNGILIAAEGIDGAGKRTICSFMKELLESYEYKVTTFAYPDYYNIWGKIIEDYLHNKIELNINEQFFAYFIDILKDKDKIAELLRRGNIVITDRYFSSPVAFQCAKGFDYQKALSIIRMMDIVEPDLTLFIQIPPKLACHRKYQQKNYLDRHEKDLKLLEDVDIMYEKMLSQKILSKKWVKINGDQDPKKIEENIQNILNMFLGKNLG